MKEVTFDLFRTKVPFFHCFSFSTVGGSPMREDLRTAFITRQYMISNDFELYYYKDLKMKSAGAHKHNYYEFYFFIGGNITMVIEGKRVDLVPGDLVVIPPGVSHCAIINDMNRYYERFVLWITMDYCNQLLDLSPDFGYFLKSMQRNSYAFFHFDSVPFNAVQSKIFGVIQELHSERFGSVVKSQMNLNDLIIDINRNIYEANNPVSVVENAGLTQKLLSYIDDHLVEDLNLDVLSTQFYLSKYYISHLFKEQMGVSIHKYIIKKRLNLFKDYVRQEVSINNACLLCGFTDYSTFYRDFKKEFGISPNDYKAIVDAETKTLCTSKSSAAPSSIGAAVIEAFPSPLSDVMEA